MARSVSITARSVLSPNGEEVGVDVRIDVAADGLEIHRRETSRLLDQLRSGDRLAEQRDELGDRHCCCQVAITAAPTHLQG